MPAALMQARANLVNPPRIFTEIAIEQVDGDANFFTHDVPAAFTSVTDTALVRRFTASNAAVIKALAGYKTYLEHDLEPKPADSVLARLQREHPAPNAVLATTQNVLDSLPQFVIDHHIATIPPSDPAHVIETPPFERSTTVASMDAPGPFETAKVKAYYNVTLPDPRWPNAEREAYMRSWYPAMMSNVSVHEVYPGHYVQFLYAKNFPSDVRKVFSANTNVEGWAHYDEQMVLDEGFHAGDPTYRLAQLQDTLLRDTRFLVGIKLHTQGLTIDEATRLFGTEGHQPHPVAVAEAKRGAGDPLYGYYTMGKLMILKLRDDHKAKQGASYTLQGFHDAFLALGPLPLLLIRRAMLGQSGELFPPR